MILDISPVLSGEKSTLDIAYELPQDDAALLAENLFGAQIASPVSISGAVSDSGGYTLLRLSAGFDYTGECARCLAPVSGRFSLDLEHPVAAAGSLAGDDEDNYVISQDGKIDIDQQLCEELALAFPTRLLCSPDCPGLCPVCGKPKKEGDCGCETKEIDPRLKILAQLLEK